MNKGIRMIDGKEFLLCGREMSKVDAVSAKTSLLRSWSAVRICKLNDYDYMLYVHGAK